MGPGSQRRIDDAASLLNLCGVRFITDDCLGIWSDLDCSEAKSALKALGLQDLRCVHLESRETPIAFKVRSCPELAKGQ